jgi:hypothetical protein
MNVDLIIREAAARNQAGVLPFPCEYVVLCIGPMTPAQDVLARVAGSMVRRYGLRGLPFFIDFGDEVAYRVLCELIEESGA